MDSGISDAAGEDSQEGCFSTQNDPMMNSTQDDQIPNGEGPSTSNRGMTSTNGMDENKNEDEDDDNLSTISGLSDLSGADWKPHGTGPFSWVQAQMMKGADPRPILQVKR